MDSTADVITFQNELETFKDSLFGPLKNYALPQKKKKLRRLW